MAERRMLTRKITDDDRFTELSSSAQALYMHLNMAADDDGFNSQVSTAMFRAHASVQDLEALLSKRFIIQFENGVIVIKHWRMANALRKDRYSPTSFQEELARLDLKANGAYTERRLPDGCQMVASRLPDGCHRIGEDREDKDSTDQGSQGERGSGGKQEALPAPVEKPVENSTPANGETDGRIDFFAKQILIHKRHGYKTDVLYSWAANEGYSAAVIDDRIIQLEQQKEAEQS